MNNRTKQLAELASSPSKARREAGGSEAMGACPQHHYNSGQERIDVIWRGFLAIAIALGVMYLPLDAMAQVQAGQLTAEKTSVSAMLCNVISWMNGPIGKSVATLALVIVGVGALMGKVSWGMAIIVGLGVALLFGATTIVDALGGNGSEACNQGKYLNAGTGG